MPQPVYPVYTTKILPALQKIQAKYGYLDTEELKKVSAESGIPLHSYHEVGSFFPLFRFTKPPKVCMRVCRDQACHAAGSDRVLSELQKQASEDLEIEGVSCLGRCDRRPAAVVEVSPQGQAHHGDGEHEHFGHEYYYHGKTAAELSQIANQCLAGNPPRQDFDADQPYRASDWTIDIYKGQPSTYAAVQKAVAARDASLAKAADIITEKFGWGREKVELFRRAARRRLMVDEDLDDDVLNAVRAWQTDDDWAKGRELGGWSDAMIEALDTPKANLRGLGGAGFWAKIKWRDVRDTIRTARRRKADDRGFVVVNGDESEPSTFKDREILLRTPHLVLEGVILAGLFTEATQGFIYIRHEYPEQIKACREAIKRAEQLGFCGMHAPALGRPFPVSVFVSPGGYIQGEESSLIEAMSDRRGEPRNMPPMLTTNGLDDRPTLLSNVETFGWAPYIWLHGGQSYGELGVTPWKGKRFFSVCGDVERPGVYEVQIGMQLRDLIMGENYCRGIKGGKKFKSFAPSGPSGGFVPPILIGDALPPNHKANKVWLELCQRRGLDPNADQMDILDFDLELDVWRQLCPTRSLGGGVCVYSEERNMADQAVNSTEFYRNESCGKCVPCRLGSQKLAQLGQSLLNGRINAQRWRDEMLPLIKELDDAIIMTSICGLGRSVPLPLRTAIQFFSDDVARYTGPR